MPEKIVRKYTNNQLADIFEKIASLLEIKGEVIYKILAYRKASESLRNQSPEALEMWKNDRLQEIPGIGKAIAEQIDELFTTAGLGFLDRLSQEVPPSLVELLRIPDLALRKLPWYGSSQGLRI